MLKTLALGLIFPISAFASYCLNEDLSNQEFTNAFQVSLEEGKIEAIKGYTKNDFVYLNGYLDSGYDSFRYFRFKNLDEYQSPPSLRASNKTIESAMFFDWPLESDIIEQLALIEDGISSSPKSPCDFYTYSGQIIERDFEVGDVFKFQSLLSTSIKKRVAAVFARSYHITYPISRMYSISEITRENLSTLIGEVEKLNKYLFKIFVPKDSKLGVYVSKPNDLTAHSSEYEFLMKANLCLRVDKKSQLSKDFAFNGLTELELSVVSESFCP